jgi:hypothetical protein
LGRLGRLTSRSAGTVTPFRCSNRILHVPYLSKVTVRSVTPVLIIHVAMTTFSLLLLTAYRESRLPKPPTLPRTVHNQTSAPIVQYSKHWQQHTRRRGRLLRWQTVKGRVTKHTSPAACEVRLLPHAMQWSDKARRCSIPRIVIGQRLDVTRDLTSQALQLYLYVHA